ncbi:hypothetical protein [Saccharopolyspora pogona]|uniref:hypothetical protein n=1 Tax=Saccharopolyspora pogona TaxID=333966 RepID=UPI001CC24028|nr:hypothetical protein [Saccharopolyspora pogona]
MRRALFEPVARWFAGASDWHPLALYEIVLERNGPKWQVTYLMHGERHACIGFESEADARRDVEHLMTRGPAGQQWHEACPDR